MADERRRSARRLLGAEADIHLGSTTVRGLINDISQHGMGVTLPAGTRAVKGTTAWIVSKEVAEYAITATICRVSASGEQIGVEFDEILEGPTLMRIESLPLAD